jgi:cytochrome b561
MNGDVRWRNGEHGYGLITKSLHWLVVVLITTQFVIGYLLDIDGRGRGRGRGRSGESGRGRGRGGDYDPFGDDTLLTVHVVLGATILLVVAVRSVWRVTTVLPPWASGLSAGERRLAHWTERGLYLCMFAIPVTGLWLVASEDEGVLIAHVATHIMFFVAVAAHIGLVLKHQLIDRDRLLRRMT